MQNGAQQPADEVRTGDGAMASDRLRTRLKQHKAVLVLIDRRRRETGNPNIGWVLEKKVLEIEMADLEAAIIAQEKYGARLLAESDDLA